MSSWGALVEFLRLRRLVKLARKTLEASMSHVADLSCLVDVREREALPRGPA